MNNRMLALLLLVGIALASSWLMNRVSVTELPVARDGAREPDYYMEDFTTTTMDEDGLPLNRLYAVYMEHDPVDDSLHLREPRLEIFRRDNDPLYIAAETGLVTDDNETITLNGRVRMWEEAADGSVNLNVETSEVRILVLEEYAETDQNAVISAKRTTITGRGIRAYFAESRLEILDHAQTLINPPDKS